MPIITSHACVAHSIPRSQVPSGRRITQMIPARAQAGSGSGGTTPNRGLGLLEWGGSLVPQGALVKGVKAAWRAQWLVFMRELAPQSAGGSYSRPQYTFQGVIGDADFPAEPGRYHVYVGNPCPWCHRVLLALAVLGLTPGITYSWLVDDPERASRGGWVFDGARPDPILGCRDLREVYTTLSPGYVGRCTAPLLVDRKTRRIVSNESSLILRSLAGLTGWPGSTRVDLRPPELAAEIDAWNERLYEGVNNAVYRSGFATSQAAYDAAQRDLYATLDDVELRLGQQRFLCGPKFSEADLRLFPTIARFDAVYAVLFKCSRRRVADYPALSRWMRDVHSLQVPGSQLQIAQCYDLEDAKRSYFQQLFPLNPGSIIPSGPTVDDLGLGPSQASCSNGSSSEDAFHLCAQR